VRAAGVLINGRLSIKRPFSEVDMVSVGLATSHDDNRGMAKGKAAAHRRLWALSIRRNLKVGPKTSYRRPQGKDVGRVVEQYALQVDDEDGRFIQLSGPYTLAD